MSLIDQEIDIIEKHSLVQLKAKAYQLKGSIYSDLEDNIASIEAYKKSLDIVLPTGDKEVIINNYKLLSEVFKDYGNSDSALKYYKLYTQVKDSAFTLEQHKSVAEYEAKFGINQKEKEIDMLNRDKTSLTEKLRQQKTLLIFLLLGITCVLFLSFRLYKQYKRNKKINQLLKEQSKMLKEKLSSFNKQQKSIVTVKYESSLLTAQDIEEIHSKVLKTFKEFNIYLDPNLTLPWLAEKLNVLPNHLSQVINQKTNQNFNDFINYYRIEEAKSRLLDNRYDNFTIEAVGKSVGFNSKTTFISAFKKFEQTYPSQFKKLHVN